MMGIIAKIEAWLQGKKTYLVMIIAIAGAIVAYLNGEMSVIQMAQAIMAAFGIGALRSGITKSGA